MEAWVFLCYSYAQLNLFEGRYWPGGRDPLFPEVFIVKNVTLGMKMQVKLPGPMDQGQEKRSYIEW